MKKLILLTAALFVSANAHAESARVLKAKGNKALIQTDGASLSKGDVIEIGGSSGFSPGGSSSGGGGGSRERTLGLTGQLSSLSTSPGGGSASTFLAVGRYGWNKVQMEYGPVGSFTYASTSGYSSRTLQGGGFFDYNLMPNDGSKEVIFGVGAIGQLGFGSERVGSRTESTTIFNLVGGPFAKAFVLGNSVAIRGDAWLYWNRESGGGSTVTTSGVMVLAGLQVYF